MDVQQVSRNVTLNVTHLIRREDAPERLVTGLLDPPPRPTRWTTDLVAWRLLEARRTLARMPMSTRPQGLKTLWPVFQGMTERETRNLVFEAEAAGTQRELYASRNRVRIPPSSSEIERMEEAISWVMRYLKDDAESASCVSAWIEDTERRPDAGTPEFVSDALSVISQGLNRERVKVR